MASIYADSSLLKFKPSDETETVLELFVGPEKSDKPFTSNADFFCFCAALGKNQDRFVESRDRSSSAFKGQVDEQTFKNRDIDRYIYAIALDKEKDLEILKQTDKCYKIFEGYINGGLEIIREKEKGVELEILRDSLMNEVRSLALNNISVEDDFTEFEINE